MLSIKAVAYFIAVFFICVGLGSKLISNKPQSKTANKNTRSAHSVRVPDQKSNRKPIRKKAPKHKRQDYLATASERRFLVELKKVLDGRYNIHCQVPLISIATPINFKDRSRSWAKRIDFVITERDSKIVAAIELDDASHSQPKRIARDEYVKEALDGNHKLLRFKVKSKYDIEEIYRKLSDAGIDTKQSEMPTSLHHQRPNKPLGLGAST